VGDQKLPQPQGRTFATGAGRIALMQGGLKLLGPADEACLA
jgi:hypothetical protein